MPIGKTASSAFIPYDESPEWREIFERLSTLMDPRAAYSWFGHCRFIRKQSDSIELAHWTRFGARESLREYGEHLCAAANVREIRMHRSGGTVPATVQTHVIPRPGYETFHKPAPRLEAPKQDEAA